MFERKPRASPEEAELHFFPAPAGPRAPQGDRKRCDRAVWGLASGTGDVYTDLYGCPRANLGMGFGGMEGVLHYEL